MQVPIQMSARQRYYCLSTMCVFCLATAACTTQSHKSLGMKTETNKTNLVQEKAKTVITGPVEIFHKNKEQQPLWNIQAASSNVSYTGKQGTSGKLEKVQGELFKDGKISTHFTADHATIDEAKEILYIQGNVQLRSDKTQTTLYADRVSWAPNEKMFQAKGNVRIVSRDYTFGPVPELRANADITDIGTPDTFKGNIKNR